MDPVKTCSQVLQQIRQSGLNFVFSESPFGVNISIKKLFRKNTSHDSINVAYSAVKVNEKSDAKVDVATDTIIKDLKSKIKSLKEENKDTENCLDDYRLSDKKILKELKIKDKEIYNISRDLEKEKDNGEILAMEIKELKCELAQEKKEKIKFLKKDLNKLG